MFIILSKKHKKSTVDFYEKLRCLIILKGFHQVEILDMKNLCLKSRKNNLMSMSKITWK